MNMKRCAAIVLIFIIVLPLQRKFTNTQQRPYQLSNTEFIDTRTKIKNKLAEPVSSFATSKDSIDQWSQTMDGLISTLGKRSQQLANEAKIEKNKKLREANNELAMRGPITALPIASPSDKNKTPANRPSTVEETPPLISFPIVPPQLDTALKNIISQTDVLKRLEPDLVPELDSLIKSVGNIIDAHIKKQKKIEDEKEKILETEATQNDLQAQAIENLLTKEQDQNLLMIELENKLITFLEKTFVTEKEIDQEDTKLLAHLTSIKNNVEHETYALALIIIADITAFKKAQLSKLIPEANANKIIKDTVATLQPSLEEQEIFKLIGSKNESIQKKTAGLKRKNELRANRVTKRIKFLKEALTKPPLKINSIIEQYYTDLKQKNKKIDEFIISPEKQSIIIQEQIATLNKQALNELEQTQKLIDTIQTKVTQLTQKNLVPFKGTQTLVNASKANLIYWLKENPITFYSTLTGIYNTLETLLKNESTKKALIIDLQAGKYKQAIQGFLLLLQTLSKTQTTSQDEHTLITKYSIDLYSFLLALLDLFKQNGVIITDAPLLLGQANKIVSDVLKNNVLPLEQEKRKPFLITLKRDPLLLEWPVPSSALPQVIKFKEIIKPEVTKQITEKIQPLIKELEKEALTTESEEKKSAFDKKLNEFKKFLMSIKNEWEEAISEGNDNKAMQDALSKLEIDGKKDLTQLLALIKTSEHTTYYNLIKKEYDELIKTYEEKITDAQKEEAANEASSEPDEITRVPEKEEYTEEKPIPVQLTPEEKENLQILNKFTEIIQQTDQWTTKTTDITINGQTKKTPDETDTTFALSKIVDALVSLLRSLPDNELSPRFPELDQSFYTYTSQIIISLLSLINQDASQSELNNDITTLLTNRKIHIKELDPLFRISYTDLDSWMGNAANTFDKITNSKLKEAFKKTVTILPNLAHLILDKEKKEFLKKLTSFETQWEESFKNNSLMKTTDFEVFYDKVGSISDDLVKMQHRPKNDLEKEKYNQLVTENNEFLGEIRAKIKELKEKEAASKKIIYESIKSFNSLKAKFFKQTKIILTRLISNKAKNKGELHTELTKTSINLNELHANLKQYLDNNNINKQDYDLVNSDFKKLDTILKYVNLLDGLLSNRQYVIEQITTLINQIENLPTQELSKAQNGLKLFDAKAIEFTENLTTIFSLIKKWAEGNLENYINFFKNAPDSSIQQQVATAQELENILEKLRGENPEIITLINIQDLTQNNDNLITQLNAKIDDVKDELKKTIALEQKQEFVKVKKETEEQIQQIIQEIEAINEKLKNQKLTGDIRLQIGQAQDSTSSPLEDKNKIIKILENMEKKYPDKKLLIDKMIENFNSEVNRALESLNDTEKKLINDLSFSLITDYLTGLAEVFNLVDKIKDVEQLIESEDTIKELQNKLNNNLRANNIPTIPSIYEEQVAEITAKTLDRIQNRKKEITDSLKEINTSSKTKAHVFEPTKKEWQD